MTSLFNQSTDKQLVRNKPSLSSFWRTAKNNVSLRQRSTLIQPVQDRSWAPLSLNQERLWWSERAYPNSSIQNLQHQINLTGTLHLGALQQSLWEILQRHEILRTIVHDHQGQPAQVILPEVPLELPILDLQHLVAEEQAAEVQKLALAQAEQPFDLEKGPLWRFQLLRLSNIQYILLYTVSHLAFDAWSHGVLIRELGTLYEAFLNGQPSPLVALPIQYADFSEAQHQWLQDNCFSPQLTYWQQQLSGNLPALDLPTDYLRSSAPIYQPDCQSLALSEPLTQALKTLSSEHGVSLYVTLLAAFKVLLYRYTGQRDLLVNSPVAGRYQRQTRGLIGCFINTLPIRTMLAEKEAFSDFLQQVSQVTEEAFANQDVPFRQLTELINLSDTPMMGPLFILQNVPYPVLELSSLTMRSTYLHRTGGDQQLGNYFDLTLSIQENAGVLTASLAYNAVLFNEDRIQRMLGHYQTLLESIVTDPHGAVATLPMLTAMEQHQLLVEWRQPQIDYPADTCIYQWMADQISDRSFTHPTVYVLDSALQLVPIGVPGELYVSINDADREHYNFRHLTPENFVASPFQSDVSAQLYRTGDLVEYFPDGTLGFLGQTDRQIKVRGFRLNVRDIETGLNHHPAINRAVVVAQVEASGNQCLIAYVVAQDGELPKPGELRHFLQQFLPHYMIPSGFVPLECFPVTVDNQIDYAALPVPEPHQLEPVSAFVAPRIELERRLAQIWSEILGVPSISMQDNFFDIGGNSLLAIQAVAQIERTCGYQMPIIDFFRAQTIEELAKLLLSPLLQQEAWSLPWNPLEPVQSEYVPPQPAKAPVFILNGGFNQFLTGAIWIARRLGQEQPCYSLHLRGLDGKEDPQDRLEDMAAEAIQGIRTIQPEGPYYLVGLCFGGMLAYEMAQQLRHQGQKVALLFVVESMSPIPKGNKAKHLLQMVPTPDMFDERTRTNPVLLRVFEGVYHAIVTYEAEPYPGQVIVCQASEGTEQEQYERERYLETWKQLSREVEVHILPGDHLSLYDEENIGTLVHELKACLARSQQALND